MKSSMAELPDEQDMLTEQEIDGSLTPNPLPASLWRRTWRASITAVAYLFLYTLSQVTGLWVLYMLNGYRAFPAAYKVLGLLQYILSNAESSDQQMEIWRVECVCPLLATLFLGVVILGTGALFCLRTLVPGNSTGFLDDRRQSISRQPSFTYSEWTDAKQEDFYELDTIPETPVFDCFMDMKADGDPTTLTVKPVGLQERRGSNVSLTLDMCTPGTTEPYGMLLSPRDQSTQEYLENASNPLTPAQLHMRALDDAVLQAEFYEAPMNFVDPKEYNIPGVVRKNRYKTILPNTHSRVCLQGAKEDDFLSTYINANYLKGYGGQEKVYIATQGPTVNTVGDFWRMVWQERCPIIVMITNIEEKNEKCTEYWPEDSMTCEGIEITVKQFIQADDYSLRSFTVKCVLGHQTPLFPWNTSPSIFPAVDDWFKRSEQVWEVAHQHLEQATKMNKEFSDNVQTTFLVPGLYLCLLPK
ncbi:tyrosine-protein phosphatase non-receptor type 5 isoform X3 [Pangasianodon hypophthalmus]|uniref:tyrosine-protein phosphatase non-receptor type 5 isoform X3 n=1 Tax=Pangasianodon hypophthalmus TaxID=310915 RepID=UPI000EFE1E1E|nr:tyrosine-protein phosphatase non-receptor type 5 isoform X3 [Pangasianodon hypophthalmus]